MVKHIFFLVLVALALGSCLKIDNQFSKIPPGMWRGVLQFDPPAITPNPKGKPLEDKLNLRFEEVTQGELPFTFEVFYTDDTTFYIELINGAERMRLDDIQFGRSKHRAKDSIRINFPVYDTYIVGLFEEGIIEGEWVVNYRENYRIPFVARFGQDHRFTKMAKTPVMDVSGTWAVTFGPGGDEPAPFPAIGEFKQQGNKVEGTFRTETGDYRFLEGTVQGNKLYLSVFDGSHAFLFEALLDEKNQTMTGLFRSGKTYRTVWQARRDDKAALPDPDSLTFLRPGYEALDFAFLQANGELLGLNDPSLQGKAKLVQILGTWCPNCRDETVFLRDYLQSNPHPDLAVVGIAFERYRDTTQALAAIGRYQRLLQLPYPLVWGGYYDKEEAAKALPALNHVLSYPTLLFLDRNNRVVKIHTGFNGPATSAYPEFRSDFEETVKGMVGE